MLSALCLYPGFTWAQSDCRMSKAVVISQHVLIETSTWVVMQEETKRWRIMLLNLIAHMVKTMRCSVLTRDLGGPPT